MTRFTGKIALVTGGTSGIGLATARRLRDEGAHVYITGRDEDRIAKAVAELGGEVTGVRADAADRADIDRLVTRIADERGRLDVLFANAGVGTFRPAADLTDDDIATTVDVNLTGVLLLVRKASTIMGEGGAIVLNASILAHRGTAGSTVYGATKAAVVNLAKSFGAELGGRGIRVNSVSPGYTRTPMLEGNVDETGLTVLAAQTALGRIGRPSELAAAVAFLAGEDASFVTGQDLIVDGGVTGSVAP